MLTGVIGSTNGVQDCCDFIKVHAMNGVILNGLLLWADIQRKVTPENIWKVQAVKKFDSEEITESKDLLWRIAGDSILGKMVKRQGANKTSSECSDICYVLTSLSEKDSLPMFLGTSNMGAQTPIYIAAQSENGSSEVTNTHLKTIEESINYLLTSSCEEKVERTQNEPSGANRPSLEATRKEKSPWSNGNGTATTTTTKLPDNKLDEDNNENDWTRVDYRSNARKSWRQKQTFCVGLLFILLCMA